MISIQRLNARGVNGNGESVVDYLLETEYYLDKSDQKQETMRYGGRGAISLGLLGKAVVKEDMLALAAGFAPDGRALCQNAGAKPTEVIKTNRKGEPVLDDEGNQIIITKDGHRVGFDLTFSAPKAVSVAFAMAEGEDRDAILDAHRKAAQVGMDYLESKVETRRGQAGKTIIDVKGLIYSQHDHLANRNLEPNLHTHTLVYGVSEGSDGNWSTFDARELYRHRMAADQIYRNELAMEMRKLGFGIEQQVEKDIDSQETGRIWWTIAGMSDEVCETFSSRRQEIITYAEEHDIDMQAACLATRRYKDEPSFPEMQAMWRQTMAAMEANEPGLVKTIAELKQFSDVNAQVVSDEQILERLHESEAMFTEHQLVERIGMEYSGRIGQEELFQKIEEFKERTNLVRVNAQQIHDDDKGERLARINTEDRYAAPWMVDWEHEIQHRTQARMEEQHVNVAPETVEQAINDFEAKKGFKISDEQRHAVEHITMGTGGVAVLSGLAGTGKTTVSDLYSQAFIAEGKRMIGVAVSNNAAQKLQAESGMDSASVAKTLSMLRKGEMTLSDKDVVVLDEAGMVDTKDTRLLMVACHEAGAKLIMQGDTHQLQPVGAGAGMSLAKEVAGDAMLTEIRRQKKAQDRETAKDFYDQDEFGNVINRTDVKSRAETVAKGQKILANLLANDHVEEYGTQKQVVRGAIADYLASQVDISERLLVAHSRAEVAEANDLVRAAMKATGELGQRDVEFKARDGKHWKQMSLAEGDLIKFTTRDDNLGVINGSRAKVEKIKQAWEKGGGFDITVRIESDIKEDDGRTFTFNTHEYNALAHRYANTVHSAQGQGKQEIYHILNTGMADNQSTLVAFTRLTGGHYKLYGTGDDIENLSERLGLDRLKGNAVQAGLRDKPISVLEAETARMLENHSLPTAEPAKRQEQVASEIQSRKTLEDVVGQFAEKVAARRGQGQENTQTSSQVQRRGRGQSL
ncbi:MobF family relaxase [Stenotrophomonas pigmentata]|uniref:MobF family relaxase n=1 Tax=Stenotrophomonas pigmentata TaxID=3055080 RepID=UPI0026F32766|nr:MobF family relaxase [Stenotrophomonas sp. 610A2]